MYIQTEAYHAGREVGNSLAVRLPVELVRKLGLKEGDRIDLVPGEAGLSVVRHPSAQEVLEGLRGLRGRLPAGPPQPRRGA